MPAQGEELIERCKQHLISTLRTLPECAPTGPGIRNKDIETACGFALGLQRQDGWFTWSLLMSLLQDKKIIFPRGAKKMASGIFGWCKVVC